MLEFINIIGIHDSPEIAPEAGRQTGFGHAMNERFGPHPVRDHIGHGHDLDIVGRAEGFQGIAPGHVTVFVHDFTDHCRRFESGQPGQIHGPFGCAGPEHHPAPARPQRENMSGTDKVGRGGVVRHCRPDGSGPVTG